MNEKYITMYTIPVGMQDSIEVIGLPDEASYEWLLRTPTGIQHQSRFGYGAPEVALRDGLIFYLNNELILGGYSPL